MLLCSPFEGLGFHSGNPSIILWHCDISSSFVDTLPFEGRLHLFFSSNRSRFKRSSLFAYLVYGFWILTLTILISVGITASQQKAKVNGVSPMGLLGVVL